MGWDSHEFEIEIERRGLLLIVSIEGDATFEGPDPDVGFDGSHEVEFRAWIKRNKKGAPKWTPMEKTSIRLDAEETRYIEERIARSAYVALREQKALMRAGIY